MNCIAVKEHKNGDVTMQCEISPTEMSYFQLLANRRKRKCTRKFINEVIIESLMAELEKDKKSLATRKRKGKK